MSEVVTSETHKRSKKRHREDDSKENEKRSKKKHRKERVEEDKTENGVIDDVPVVSTADVAKLVENSSEIDKEHKTKKKKDKHKHKHKHKDNQESGDVVEPSNETNEVEDATGATTEPQAEKKKEKKEKKEKHKRKHKHKDRDENHKEIEENETDDNNNANPQTEPNLQAMVDLGGSSSEDILRVFQQLDLAHLQGVLGSLDLPSMGIDLTPNEPTGTIPTLNKPVNKTSKKNSAALDAEPSKKVRRKHVVDLKNLVDPNANKSHANILATKWLSSKELNQLEETQGLVFKRGKFSFTEDHALKTAVEQYRARNVLSEQQMVQFINAKRTPEHKRFWTDVALAVPGRPVQAVYHRVKRTYNPQSNQGKWISEEDIALRRAVADLGFAWTKVSERIGRTPADCRDRWRNHASLSHKQSGKWSVEEEEELTNIVRSFTIEKGKDLDSEILWTAVSNKMGGRRSREQCRNKWREDLQAKMVIGSGKRRWTQSENYILIHQMATLSVNDDSEIIWKDLMNNEGLKFSSPHNLQRQWKRLEESVPNYENMSYKDTLNVLLERYGQPPSNSSAAKKESKKELSKKKKFPQPLEPKSAEMIEDSDEDNGNGEQGDSDGEREDEQSSDDERREIDSSLKPTLEDESESEEDVEEDDVEEDSD